MDNPTTEQQQQNGQALKVLVEKYGYGIRVRALNRNSCPHSFTILQERQGQYEVQYEDNHIGLIMKECPTTNDYVLIQLAQ